MEIDGIAHKVTSVFWLHLSDRRSSSILCIQYMLQIYGAAE